MTITLSATDPDGNTPLTYNVTSAPSVGTVTNNGNGTVTYNPDTATNGTTVTFNYTAADTLGAVSNTATVTVLINSPLVAMNDTATTQARTPVTINALDNDTGGTPPRTVINLTQPTNEGTTVLNAYGTITYTPGGPGTGVCPSGTGTFTYQARDSVGGTSNSLCFGWLWGSTASIRPLRCRLSEKAPMPVDGRPVHALPGDSS